MMESSYYQRLLHIREDQATANGFEIGVNCNTGSRGFAYVVNGKTYLWRKSFTFGLPQLDDRLNPSSDIISNCANNIGEKIVVYYEANKPSNGIGENPTRLIVSDFLFFLSAVILVPLAFLLSFRNWFAQRTSWI